jgi:hypothetical protein
MCPIGLIYVPGTVKSSLPRISASPRLRVPASLYQY